MNIHNTDGAVGLKIPVFNKLSVICRHKAVVYRLVSTISGLFKSFIAIQFLFMIKANHKIKLCCKNLSQ